MEQNKQSLRYLNCGSCIFQGWTEHNTRRKRLQNSNQHIKNLQNENNNIIEFFTSF